MFVNPPSANLPLVNPNYYYLESDGQVFLIKQGRMWRFPRTKNANCPIAILLFFLMPFKEGNVLFAKPILDRHPAHWFHKDEVIGRTDIAPLVQKAVNRSLTRTASKVAIIEKGKVLMVRAGRGITKGIWNLPGGFVGYGEHPGSSAQREVMEELGIKVKLRQSFWESTRETYSPELVDTC